MLIFSILLVFTAQFFVDVQAVCNECQANRVACINSTSFYFCFGNAQPNYEKLYHCKPGFDCTSYNAICVASSAFRPPSCGDTSLCGRCDAHRNHMFACTSRTTFRFCYGATYPQSELGYCPDNFVCDASSDNVCVRTDKANSVTCDVVDTSGGSDGSGSSTAAATTTEAPLTAQDVCDVKQVVGVYPIPGDTTCKEYVRCFRKDGVIVGTLMPCPQGTYFSRKAIQCVLAKPDDCV